MIRHPYGLLSPGMQCASIRIMDLFRNQRPQAAVAGRLVEPAASATNTG